MPSLDKCQVAWDALRHVVVATEAPMPSQEEIDGQFTLLASHRRTLAIYLDQQANLGEHHAPPGVINGIDAERAHIQRIKTYLRSNGVEVDDALDDVAPVKKARPTKEGTRPPGNRRFVIPLLLSVAFVGAILVLLSNRLVPGTQPAIVTSATVTVSDNAPPSKILFSSNRDGRDNLYTMNSDGSDPHRLLNLSNNLETRPAWSRDGTRIAFISLTGSGDHQLHIVNANGTARTHISRVNDEFYRDYGPASWSPDGKFVALTSTCGTEAYEICIVKLDDASRINLTNNAASDSAPAWSPDGKKIAFVSDRGGNQDIYIMNADGTDIQQLTKEYGADNDPAWSPDGTKIAYSSSARGNADIVIMNPDGSNKTPLTDNLSQDNHPTWSPDGHKIAFASSRDDPDKERCIPGICVFDIYTMNVDGSEQMNISHNPANDDNPSWQPLP